MKRLVLILPLISAACASTGDIYQSEVDFSETTAKPLTEVSQCLQLRWALAPVVTPDGKTSFMMKNGWGSVLGIAALSPTPEGGTRIEIKKTGQVVFGGRDYRKCL